jgi:hypothetical protein
MPTALMWWAARVGARQTSHRSPLSERMATRRRRYLAKGERGGGVDLMPQASTK